jgi:hypothetical protein
MRHLKRILEVQPDDLTYEGERGLILPEVDLPNYGGVERRRAR